MCVSVELKLAESSCTPKSENVENKSKRRSSSLLPLTILASARRRDRDDFEVLEAVKAGKWEWPKHVSVSDSAKEFVAALLVVDPLKRLTCEQALKHPWMQVLA